ncbi:hypothetical protein FRB99_004093, partial [Tulasnella sp. 403]
VHDIAKGLEYMHSRIPPVIHGGIKATHVLVSNDGVVIITDFGTSELYTDHQQN